MLYCLNPTCSQPENPDDIEICQGCGALLTESSQNYLFQERYLISQLIEQREFKKTYLAEDQKNPNQLRLIKQFSPLLLEKERQQFATKFKNLSEKLIRLNHPQIAKIYEYFFLDNNFYWVEEYLEGKTLLAELQEEPIFQYNQFTDTKIRALLSELLPVLSYLHRNKILHGNINAENIFRPDITRFSEQKDNLAVAEVTVIDSPSPEGNEESENSPQDEAIAPQDFPLLPDPFFAEDNPDNPSPSQLLLPSSTGKDQLILETQNHDTDIQNGLATEQDSSLESATENNQHQPENPETENNLSPNKIEPLSPKSPMGRGKKLILINLCEKLLFPELFSVDATLEETPKRSGFIPAYDIYDLGLTCIHLLTGSVPQLDEKGNIIKNAKQETWEEQLEHQYNPISERLEDILSGMILPQGGYQSAADVINALYSNDFTPLIRSFTPDLPKHRKKKRQPISRRELLKLAGWGGVGLVTTLGVNSWWRNRGAPWEKELKPFEFEAVTVNPQGEIIKRLKKRANSVIVDLGNNIKMEFVAVPGGEFMIGSPDTELGRRKDESPQRKIQVPSFFMSKYLVTQAQWKAVMEQNPSYFKGENRPVEMISWLDCVEFCQKLAKIVDRDCRLASEAEWEYACRGGTTTPFAYGETITRKLANYDGFVPYALEGKGSSSKETTEVGIFPPNPFGLYDLHGNVWEWCEDTAQNDYSYIPRDGRAWIENKKIRRLRGGAWVNIAHDCRSANRNQDVQDARLYNYGCRVVVSAKTPLPAV